MFTLSNTQPMSHVLTPFFARIHTRMRAAAHAVLLGTLVATSACSDDDVVVPETASTVDVLPRVSEVRAGATVQLTAQAKDANGANMTNDVVVWSTLDSTVATVNQSGLVTVLSSGGAAIVATTRGASGFASIDAIGNVASVSITGSTGSLPIGQTVQLAATPLEANGRELFRPITWTSSAPAVATVSNTGLVTTVGVGSTVISAASEGKTATLNFTVLPPTPVATVTLSLSSGYLPTSVSVPLTATLRDAAGGVLSARVVTWTTSNAAIATVSATGVVNAIANGAVTITATSEGKTASGTFTAIPGLRSATGVTFTNSVEKTSAFYAVFVPAGSTSLNATLRGGNGDPDLYLYRPGQSLTSAAECASENGGTTIVEDCVRANPVAGVWVVEVFAYLAHAGTTLTATVTPTPP